MRFRMLQHRIWKGWLLDAQTLPDKMLRELIVGALITEGHID